MAGAAGRRLLGVLLGGIGVAVSIINLLPVETLVDQNIAHSLSMVMALLMALVGSWIASDRVTRPLQVIRNSARNISEGRLNENIRVETRSAEIQDLAKNLNRSG